VIAVLIWKAWDITGWISIYFTAAVAGYIILRHRSNPWFQAAATMLLPAAIALGVLIPILTFVNLSYLPDPASAEAIGSYELSVVHLSILLSAWMPLSWWKLICILIVLLCISRYAPRVKPVSHFLAVQKVGEVTIWTLTFLLNFSFFTDNAIEKQADRSVRHITVVYTSSRDHERQHLGRYLATRATREVFSRVPEKNRQFIAQFTQAIAAVPSLNEQAKAEIVDYVAGGRSIGLPAESLPEPNERDVRLHADTIITEQRAKENIAAELEASEQRKAFQEMFGATLGVGTAAVEGLAKHVLDTFLGAPLSEFLRPATEFLDQVADNYFERETEPVVTKEAALIQQHLDLWLARDNGAEPAKAVSTVIQELAVDRVKELADQIARAAHELDAAQDKGDAILADRRATVARFEARHLSETFGVLVNAQNPAFSAASTAVRDAAAALQKAESEYKKAVDNVKPVIPDIGTPDIDDIIERGKSGPERDGAKAF
jgi:hypothetical protein